MPETQYTRMFVAAQLAATAALTRTSKVGTNGKRLCQMLGLRNKLWGLARLALEVGWCRNGLSSAFGSGIAELRSENCEANKLLGRQVQLGSAEAVFGIDAR